MGGMHGGMECRWYACGDASRAGRQATPRIPSPQSPVPNPGSPGNPLKCADERTMARALRRHRPALRARHDRAAGAVPGGGGWHGRGRLVGGRGAGALGRRASDPDRCRRHLRVQHQPATAGTGRSVRAQQGGGDGRALRGDQSADRGGGGRGLPHPDQHRRVARCRLRPGDRCLRQLSGQGRDHRLVPAAQAAAADRGLGGRAHRSDPGADPRRVAHRA
ncbi:hypothetical protein NB689_003524 [Xanthomonas sacchari]|nr:hypothetical protein [Xanthomonas sacchari]